MTIKSLKTFEDYRFLYDDFAAKFEYAVNIDTTKRYTLYCERPSTCTSTVAMPSTVDIVWFPNSICAVSGSLTLQGAFYAGNYPLFSGAGTVLLNLLNIKEVLPAWFNETYADLTKTRAAIATSGIPINIGKISADPSTTGWGSPEGGSHWYNSTQGKPKMWNGSEIVLLG